MVIRSRKLLWWRESVLEGWGLYLLLCVKGGHSYYYVFHRL